MVKLSIRSHPDVLFAYSVNYLELVLRVENHADHPFWAEADVAVPEKLSLSPNGEVHKGRLRVGIVEKNQYLEKAVRIYANAYTNPQMYQCRVTLYSFDKDGVIDSRLEKEANLRCEAKKEATL